MKKNWQKYVKENLCCVHILKGQYVAFSGVVADYKMTTPQLTLPRGGH